MKTFKKFLAILCTAALLLTSVFTGTVFAADDTASSVDYSAITFDTENGTAGNLGSTVWSFHDAAENAIGGNATKMLKLHTSKKGSLEVKITYGEDLVALTAGKTYRLDFYYYADAGVDIKQATVRNQSKNIQVVKLTIDATNGTNGAWVHQKVVFTAPEGSTSLKMGIETNSATEGKYVYLDNLSLVELPAETQNDYSNITFDTANGTAGNLGSSVWSFYDAYENPVADNNSIMLKLSQTTKGNAMFNVNYGKNAVPLTAGAEYRFVFSYYVEDGIDVKQATVRNQSANIQVVKLSVDPTNGTNGAWVQQSVTFIAIEGSTSLKMGIETNSITVGKYIYLDNLSLVMTRPAEVADDYSNITFDTAYGISGALGSSVWNFYDAAENAIAGNSSRMLKLHTSKSGQLNMTIRYGTATIPVNGETAYRLEFDFYSEAGVDIKHATVRVAEPKDDGSGNYNSICVKEVTLPISTEGTNGKWVHQIVFFTPTADAEFLQFGVTTNTATENKYMYFDNFSLTEFDSDAPITFEGKTSGAQIDSGSSVWRYTSASVAGNDTTKIVYNHNGQASGAVYNDLDEAVAVASGSYYIVKFDYYMEANTGTLGAIYNNAVGYKCNLSIDENGTGGEWKTSTTIFKATGSTELFKFTVNPQNATNNIILYIDNLSVTALYECFETPEIESIAPGKITVKAVEGYEYSVDGTHFTTAATFKNLSNETDIFAVYIREALCDNGYPSAPSTAVYVQLPHAGDINNDRTLDVNDLVGMRTRLLNIATEIDDAFFDANKDNNVNLIDLVNLKKQVANPSDISVDTTVVRNGITYNLAWNDDFTGSYINRNNWVDRLDEVKYEIQNYEADNVAINNDVDGNSCLVLTAEKSVDEQGNVSYTSGAVDTYGKFTFKRGYVEMRAKLARGVGLWSGFWFGGTSNRAKGDEVSWPENGEIDVIEYYGYEPSTVYHNFHYATYDENNAVVANKIRNDKENYCTTMDGNFYDDFHTFGCEWTDDYVAFYVDGVLSCTYEKDTETFAKINAEDMYILLTLAVGGSESAIEGIENTEFPSQMAVDYVRYYK